MNNDLFAKLKSAIANLKSAITFNVV